MSETQARGASDVVVEEGGGADEVAGDPPLMDQIKELAMGSKINVLYVCIPIAFIASWAGGSSGVIFVAAFLALVPLAAALGDLTEDLALRTNDAIGALINVTFGNATELIISFAALRLEKYELIKMSLAGSILGNMLLVMGTACLVAGLKWPTIRFNSHAAQTYMSSLILATFAFIVPTSFSTLNKNSEDPHYALQVSQAISILLVLIYGAYIYFQVGSHKSYFDGEKAPPQAMMGWKTPKHEPREKDDDNDAAAAAKSTTTTNADGEEVAAAPEEEEEEEEVPQFSFAFALVGLAVIAILISILSDMLVESVSGAAEQLHLGQHFIGLVLVPIVGNVAEHASAIVMAAKGKMDIAIGIALGSSIQIAMFAMPFTVIVSFLWGKELNMNLTPFVAGCLFATVLLTHSILVSGSSTWLSGAKLMVAYLILLVAFLFAPDDALTVITTTMAPTTTAA